MSGRGKQAGNKHDSSASAGAGSGGSGGFNSAKKITLFGIGETKNNATAADEVMTGSVIYDQKGTLGSTLQNRELPAELAGTRGEWTFAFWQGEPISNKVADVKRYLSLKLLSGKKVNAPGLFGSMTPQRHDPAEQSISDMVEALLRPRDSAILQVMEQERAITLEQADGADQEVHRLQRVIATLTAQKKKLVEDLTPRVTAPETRAALTTELEAIKELLENESMRMERMTLESKRLESTLTSINRSMFEHKFKEAKAKEELTEAHALGTHRLIMDFLNRVKHVDRRTVESDHELKERMTNSDLVGFVVRFEHVLQGANSDVDMQLIELTTEWRKDVYPADSTKDFPTWLATQLKTQTAYVSIPNHGSDTVQVSMMRTLLRDCVILKPLLDRWAMNKATVPATFLDMHTELASFHAQYRAEFQQALTRGRANQAPAAFAVTDNGGRGSGGRGGKGGRGDGGRGAGGRGDGDAKRGVCFRWAENGTCQFGDKCNFKHDKPSKDKGQGGSGTTFRACHAMQNTGKCDKGDDCPYKSSHEASKAFHNIAVKGSGGDGK